jgi:two-component system, LuxR family, sensor kinase FixL
MNSQSLKGIFSNSSLDAVNAVESENELALLRLIVSTMREGVWFLDSEGITTYVNHSMAAMLGYSLDEMLGRSLFEFMDEEARSQAMKYMERRRTGISEIHEFRFRRSDGSDVWTTLSTRPLTSSHGQFSGTMATIQDITPQKKVQSELRSSKQKLRHLLEQLPLMAWSIDNDNVVTSSYGAGLKKIGIENNQLVGMTLAEHLQSWDPEKSREMMLAHERALAGESVFMVHHNFGRFIYNFIAPFYQEDHGKIIGAIGVALDVTEQVMAQQDLEKSENLLRSILKSAPDAILTVDSNGRIISFNDSATALFGIGESHFDGLEIQNLIETGEKNTTFDHFIEKMQSPCLNCHARQQKGQLVPVEISSSRVANLPLWTLIIRDVSRLRELQRQLVSIAEEQQRKLGREIHDDIGQEMTGVNMLMDALLIDLESISATNTITDLTNSLKQRLRRAQTLIRSTAHGLLVTDLDSKGLFQALSSLAENTAKLHGIKCNWLPPERPVSLSSETATQLFRIAQEAISNALRHSHGTQIQIEIRIIEETGLVELRISDNGKGITQQKTDGMGLRIMNYRAGLIGGRLTLESGKGLTICCKVKETI